METEGHERVVKFCMVLKTTSLWSLGALKSPICKIERNENKIIK